MYRAIFSFFFSIIAAYAVAECDKFNDPQTQLNLAILQLIEEKDNSLAFNLLNDGMPANQTNACDTSLLHIAAIMNDIALVQRLIKLGGSPNQINHQGETPVFMAANWQSNEILSLLLAAGGDPNIVIDKKSPYNTPLLIATTNEFIETVHILVRSGANSNYVNESGFSALALAKQKSNVELLNALLQQKP